MSDDSTAARQAAVERGERPGEADPDTFGAIDADDAYDADDNDEVM